MKKKNSFNEKRYTLVLSKSFSPLAIVGPKKCMKYLLGEGKALDPVSYELLDFEQWVDRQSDNDDKKTISTVNYYILIPEIIVLNREYIRKPASTRSGISNRNIAKSKVFTRDGWKCGYCLTPVNSKSATIDHVIPRSKGGDNTYENVVTCCKKCNGKKGDESLERMMELHGWQLHHRLIKPANNLADKIPQGKMLDSWKPYLKF